MKVTACGISDTGIKRKINQDGFYYNIARVRNEYVAVFVIADGVGGLSMGEQASKIAIQNIQSWWSLDMPKDYGNIDKVLSGLIKRLEKINTDILHNSNKFECEMATTMSLLLIYKEMYYILHIGDSRIYLVKNNVIQLTEDHTQKDKHSERMLLAQYLGGSRKRFEYQLTSGNIKANEYFVLGSDGVFNRINNKTILDMTTDIDKEYISMNDGCNQIIEKVKLRGETDNITIVVVKINK